MLSNPLIQRYRYSLLRPRQVWIYTTVYIAIIALLLYVNYTAYTYQKKNLEAGFVEYFRLLYYQFLFFQIIILWAWGAYNAGSAIKEELLKNSYDFFRMLPLSAGKKAAGILIGKNLIVLLFSFINFLLIIYFGLAGKVNYQLQLQLILLLIAVAVLLGTTALLFSIRDNPRTKKSSLVILFAILFIIPVFLNVIAVLFVTKDLQSYIVKFYNLQLPVLWLCTAIAVYLSCWSVEGILRKFCRERDPLFTPFGALLFLIGYELIALGIAYPHFIEEPLALPVFWLGTLIPAVVIVLGALKSMDKYIEYSRFIQQRLGAGKNMLAPLLRYSNLKVGLGLFVIWASFSLAAYFAAKGLAGNLHLILVMFSFYLFALFLLELYVVYQPDNSNIGLLLGFIFALQLILPMILGGVWEKDAFFFYSPLGYFFKTIESLERSLINPIPVFSILIFNFLLCVLPLVLIIRQYRRILSARRKM